ncbi:molecular chaperone DnaK [Candidatus Saccharibacteria bacterium]|jgi:molecular chaperone DnaK|nr:molecular chaperone DnaK [Candidatus Saccharibacteria bacterium]
MGKIIGIDLGTTNSAMAVVEAGQPTIISNSEGDRTTPSVVAMGKEDNRLVGKVAYRQRVTNPTDTVYAVKRLIGRRFKDKQVQKDIKLMPFKIVDGKGGNAKVTMTGKDYSPEEVSAMILSKLKADAESYLGEEVKEAVITVPAYFDDSQRQATKDAGKIAGLEVKRIINEPTAAALAYGLDKNKDEKIAVYDLGGGTFDVTILELGDGVFEVKSTNGDTHLGGEDFDLVIVNHLLDIIKKEHDRDVSDDPQAMQRLKEAAEKAKIELSSAQTSEINLPFLAEGPLNFEYNMKRSELEKLVGDLIDQTAIPSKAALKDAKLKPSDIDEVVLVGGMTRMPAVQAKVKEIFGKTPLKGVNPDEVVALGAAVQGGVLSGDVKQDIVLVDVTPLSLGVETEGGLTVKMIERNTAIPTTKSEIFSTAADNQPSVEVHVLQGEREMAPDNKSLGRFILDGIPPAPRGMPQVEVSFSLDSNGILNVTAKDKGSGKEQTITIKDSGNLSKDDIEKAQKEAEAHADEDKKKRETAEARNNLGNAVNTAEKMLKDYDEKLSDDEKEQIKDGVEEAEKSQNSEEKNDLEKAANKLLEVMQPISMKMYEQAAKESEDEKSDDDSDDKKDSDEKPVEGEIVDEKKSDKKK